MIVLGCLAGRPMVDSPINAATLKNTTTKNIESKIKAKNRCQILAFVPVLVVGR
jgi:hypothetical protein